MTIHWKRIVPTDVKLCITVLCCTLLVFYCYNGPTTSDLEVSPHPSQLDHIPSDEVTSEGRFHIGNQHRPDMAKDPVTTEHHKSTDIKRVAADRTTGQKDPKMNDKKCSQEQRQTRLRETCEWAKSHGLIDARPERMQSRYPNRMIFVDDVHKVLYCEVPKVACTSWKVFFANISGKVDPQDYGRLHDLVHATAYHSKLGFKYLTNFTYEERLYRLKNYFKFLVVRNPFEKLLSAYKDKFAQDNYHSWWYHNTLGTQIIKRYRNQPSQQALEKGKDVRFEELVRFITDDGNEIKYKYDPHWWSMQDSCYPCIIQYDYIAKLESLDEDLPEIIENIAPGQQSRFPHLNSNRKDTDKLATYYNNLSVSEMNKIKKLYLVDNEMFGYSLDDNAKECHD